MKNGGSFHSYVSLPEGIIVINDSILNIYTNIDIE